jgi:tetratricopeptide (TPR) repeat protein
VKETEMTDSKGPFLIRCAPRAMLRLALGSACTIATLLCIPDGIAILPKAQNFGVWLIRICGLWLSCYCLWTFGFLCLLYLVRALTRGIEFNADGFKLWRFGKLVRWDSVRAVSCEPQPFFAKAFCLPMVHRLTIYTAKDSKLQPHNIPSFQFAPADFQSMLLYVSEHCFEIQPSAPDLVVAEQSVHPPLKENFERARKMRAVMSVIILVGLVMYLGRRAIVNYSFNMGLKEYKAERYESAAKYYRTATFFDPTFAPAWDQLARSEYREYKHADAEKDWHKALEMKPDYVESKIGLATLYMLRRDYAAAHQLLKKAIQLSPTNLAAYMSLADLQIREFQYTSAIEILEQVAERDEANERARGLLARAYLRQGDIVKAVRQFHINGHRENNALSDDAFVLLVEAEVDIGRGDLRSAEQKLNALSLPFRGKRLPDDLLLDWISYRTGRSEKSDTDILVGIAMKRGIPDDEIELAKHIGMLPKEGRK